MTMLSIFGLSASTLVAVVAGIVIPTLSFIGGAVWWFNKRVTRLEDADEEREALVYGGENNPLNIGLVKEVKSLKEDFNNAEEERNELREQQLEILRRLESIETKIDENNEGDS
jgi:hypothetical protein